MKLLDRISVQAPADDAVPNSSRISFVAGGHGEALVRIRKGQSKFRRELLQMCGLVCAVTGPCPAEIIETAHIRAFAKHGTHELKDGILLRADIHQLFDAGRVAIDPEKFVLMMHPGLDRYPYYRELRGTPVVPGPDPAALDEALRHLCWHKHTTFERCSSSGRERLTNRPNVTRDPIDGKKISL